MSLAPGASETSRTFTSKHGTVTTMETGKIGRSAKSKTDVIAAEQASVLVPVEVARLLRKTFSPPGGSRTMDGRPAMNDLTRYQAACRAVAECKSMDEAKDIRDRAVAMGVWRHLRAKSSRTE